MDIKQNMFVNAIVIKATTTFLVTQNCILLSQIYNCVEYHELSKCQYFDTS